MQKISYELFDRILDKKCSNKELDFILHISQFQNEFGQVRGVFYKDVCLAINCCKQTFYNILRSLEEKKIIIVDYYHSNDNDWNIQFVNNVFHEYKNYRKGYLKTSYPFLHSIEFRNLSLDIKIVVLNLLKVHREEGNFKVGKEKFMKEWLNVSSEPEFEEAINLIKKYFIVSQSYNLNLVFTLKRYNKGFKDSDLYKEIKQKVILYCRRFKVNYVWSDIQDLYFILSNRKNQRKVRRFWEYFYEISFQYKTIEPALINSLISRR